MPTVQLPATDGSLEVYEMGPASPFPLTGPPIEIRTVYAAAHTVMDARGSRDPWDEPEVDWDATLAFRHRLWALGMKIAGAAAFVPPHAGLHELARAAAQCRGCQLFRALIRRCPVRGRRMRR